MNKDLSELLIFLLMLFLLIIKAISMEWAKSDDGKKSWDEIKKNINKSDDEDSD